MVYVDTTEYDVCDTMVIVVVDQQGDLVTSGTVATTSLEVGEEAAIALAITAFPK